MIPDKLRIFAGINVVLLVLLSKKIILFWNFMSLNELLRKNEIKIPISFEVEEKTYFVLGYLNNTIFEDEYQIVYKFNNPNIETNCWKFEELKIRYYECKMYQFISKILGNFDLYHVNVFIMA